MKYTVYYETKDGDSSCCWVEADDMVSAEAEVMCENLDVERIIDIIED